MDDGPGALVSRSWSAGRSGRGGALGAVMVGWEVATNLTLPWPPRSPAARLFQERFVPPYSDRFPDGSRVELSFSGVDPVITLGPAGPILGTCPLAAPSPRRLAYGHARPGPPVDMPIG